MTVTAFARLATLVHAGAENISNIMYFRAALTVGVEPTTAQLNDFLAQWLADEAVNYMGGIPHDCVLVGVEAQGFTDEGVPGSFDPVELATSHAGVPTTVDRDGNAQVGILHPVLGPLVTFLANPGKIKRSYWAYGPLTSAVIDDNNIFVPANIGSFSAVPAAFTTSLIVTGGLTWLPIKVSHRFGGIPTPAIAAYRDVTGAYWGKFASYRRSRKNNR